MSIDIRLLRENFELVLHRDQTFPRRCYEILFERHPEARNLFGRNSPGVQHAMLGQSLMMLFDRFEDEQWLHRYLEDLGAKHVGYGIMPEMYGWVYDALVSAVAEVSAGDWTDAHLQAWTEVYELIAELMVSPNGRATPPHHER